MDQPEKFVDEVLSALKQIAENHAANTQLRSLVHGFKAQLRQQSELGERDLGEFQRLAIADNTIIRNQKEIEEATQKVRSMFKGSAREIIMDKPLILNVEGYRFTISQSRENAMFGEGASLTFQSLSEA